MYNRLNASATMPRMKEFGSTMSALSSREAAIDRVVEGASFTGSGRKLALDSVFKCLGDRHARPGVLNRQNYKLL